MLYIYTFSIYFKNEISFSEIPLFRGAILNILGKNSDILFHNHIGDLEYRYSYPLIQYKRIHKKAAIMCLCEGCDVIGEFLSSKDFSLTLGNRVVNLKIEALFPKRYLVQTWDAVFHYYLRNWIALNSENYEKYKNTDEVSTQIDLLENILIGNLLSFAKGVGIEIKNQIICKLITFSTPRLVTIKGVKKMAFDVEFKSNISLPDYIGLGKHASIGCGTVVRKYNNNQNN